MTGIPIPDDELVKRAIHSSGRPSSRGGHLRWQLVMDTFVLGSTYAQQLCVRFGFDPEERVTR